MSFMQALEIIFPSMMVLAAPLILTAIGGVLSERAGVVNIGLEGLMIIGAFAAIVFNLTFYDVFGDQTKWIALLVGMAVGGVFSLLHALASITFRADQVISGVAINLLALGIGLFYIKSVFGKGQTDRISDPFYSTNIPFLSDIPIIGDLFFTKVYWTSFIAIGLAILVWIVVYYTPFGLRLRAVGEHPMAADTMGINVTRMRYLAVFLSGLLGGLGGAVFAETISHDFSHATITGQGFMAIAAMIFGKWHPIGAAGAAIFFGFAQSLSRVGPSLPYIENIPSVILLIAPYVLTIIALAGFIGRYEGPKALNVPYIKGKR
ncbi:MAG TPA: ABC transporter permease [Bacillus sp. (in: firmicutes)]|nr:ABC transporter permease [Bacillus litorisediminis]HWO78021.1 ABC transporter permease [Bacillus sp. (in: firmicutes)]